MPARAVEVEVTVRQRKILERLIVANRTPQQLAERSRIVLQSADGIPNVHQAAASSVDRQSIRRWRGRWTLAYQALVAAEQEEASERDLEKLIVAALCDEE